jgi:hypothetical protein
MPKRIGEQELADIERHIAAYPEAIGIGKLLSALAADGIVINQRTLLRRLDSLIAAQRIQASGTRKGSRYTKTGSFEGENIQPDSKTYESISHFPKLPEISLPTSADQSMDVSQLATTEIFSYHTRQTVLFISIPLPSPIFTASANHRN